MYKYTSLQILIVAALCFPLSTLAQHSIDVQRLAAKGNYYEALLAYAAMPERSASKQASLAAAKSAWALSLPDFAKQRYDLALQGEDVSVEDRARVYLSKGIIEFQEGQYQTALWYAEKVSLLLSSPSHLRSRAWLLWGQALKELKAYGAAVEKLRAALQEAPESEFSEINFLIAETLAASGKNEEAKQHYEQIPLNHERTAMAIKQLATLNLKLNKSDEAVYWIEKGQELYPDDLLDGWSDYVRLLSAISDNRTREVARIREEALSKYPESESWRALIEAGAEAYYWNTRKIGIE